MKTTMKIVYKMKDGKNWIVSYEETWFGFSCASKNWENRQGCFEFYFILFLFHFFFSLLHFSAFFLSLTLYPIYTYTSIRVRDKRKMKSERVFLRYISKIEEKVEEKMEKKQKVKKEKWRRGRWHQSCSSSHPYPPSSYLYSYMYRHICTYIYICIYTYILNILYKNFSSLRKKRAIRSAFRVVDGELFRFVSFFFFLLLSFPAILILPGSALSISPMTLSLLGFSFWSYIWRNAQRPVQQCDERKM